jgi:hypothetical protein
MKKEGDKLDEKKEKIHEKEKIISDASANV